MKKIADAMNRTAGRECFLCDGPGGVVGVYLPGPEAASRLLVPRGKQRLIMYSLCRACHGAPDALARVEGAIEASLAATGERFGTN